MSAQQLMRIAKTFLKLTVPQYALVVVVGFCASSLALTRDFGLLSKFYYSLPLVFAALGLNAYNQVLDYEIDKRSKPKRPLPAGELSEKRALIITVALFALALALALMLNLLWAAAAFIVIAVAYSNPAFRIRKLPLASNIVGGTLYGALPFLAASAIFGVFDWFFFFLFYATAIVAATGKDFEDAEHEHLFGVKTLPILVGKKSALAFIPLTLTFILLAALFILFSSGAPQKLLYACNLCLALVIAFLFVVDKALKRRISAVTQSWFASATIALVLAIQLIFGIANAL